MRHVHCAQYTFHGTKLTEDHVHFVLFFSFHSVKARTYVHVCVILNSLIAFIEVVSLRFSQAKPLYYSSE